MKCAPRSSGRRGLPQLPGAVAEQTGEQAPRYNRVYQAAVERKIPVDFEDGRWTWDEANLPAIIAGLGMKPRPRRQSRADQGAQAVA